MVILLHEPPSSVLKEKAAFYNYYTTGVTSISKNCITLGAIKLLPMMLSKLYSEILIVVGHELMHKKIKTLVNSTASTS